jgi:hypothetical protein
MAMPAAMAMTPRAIEDMMAGTSLARKFKGSGRRGREVVRCVGYG